MLDRMKLCRVYAQASGECVVAVQLHSNRRLSYVRTRSLSEVEMTHHQVEEQKERSIRSPTVLTRARDIQDAAGFHILPIPLWRSREVSVSY
jgi:hypothetical protein